MRSRLKNIVIPTYSKAHRVAEFLKTLPPDAEIRHVFQPVNQAAVIFSVCSFQFDEVPECGMIPKMHYREWEGRPKNDHLWRGDFK